MLQRFFNNHFAEAERLKKRKRLKAEAILKATKENLMNNAQLKQQLYLPAYNIIITEKGTGEKLPE